MHAPTNQQRRRRRGGRNHKRPQNHKRGPSPGPPSTYPNDICPSDNGGASYAPGYAESWQPEPSYYPRPPSPNSYTYQPGPPAVNGWAVPQRWDNPAPPWPERDSTIMAQPMFEPNDAWKQSHASQSAGTRGDIPPEPYSPSRGLPRRPVADHYSPARPRPPGGDHYSLGPGISIPTFPGDHYGQAPDAHVPTFSGDNFIPRTSLNGPLPSRDGYAPGPDPNTAQFSGNYYAPPSSNVPTFSGEPFSSVSNTNALPCPGNHYSPRPGASGLPYAGDRYSPFPSPGGPPYSSDRYSPRPRPSGPPRPGGQYSPGPNPAGPSYPGDHYSPVPSLSGNAYSRDRYSPGPVPNVPTYSGDHYSPRQSPGVRQFSGDHYSPDRSLNSPVPVADRYRQETPPTYPYMKPGADSYRPRYDDTTDIKESRAPNPRVHPRWRLSSGTDRMPPVRGETPPKDEPDPRRELDMNRNRPTRRYDDPNHYSPSPEPRRFRSIGRSLSRSSRRSPSESRGRSRTPSPVSARSASRRQDRLRVLTRSVSHSRERSRTRTPARLVARGTKRSSPPRSLSRGGSRSLSRGRSVSPARGRSYARSRSRSRVRSRTRSLTDDERRSRSRKRNLSRSWWRMSSRILSRRRSYSRSPDSSPLRKRASRGRGRVRRKQRSASISSSVSSRRESDSRRRRKLIGRSRGRSRSKASTVYSPTTARLYSPVATRKRSVGRSEAHAAKNSSKPPIIASWPIRPASPPQVSAASRRSSSTASMGSVYGPEIPPEFRTAKPQVAAQRSRDSSLSSYNSDSVASTPHEKATPAPGSLRLSPAAPTQPIKETNIPTASLEIEGKPLEVPVSRAFRNLTLTDSDVLEANLGRDSAGSPLTGRAVIPKTGKESSTPLAPGTRATGPSCARNNKESAEDESDMDVSLPATPIAASFTTSQTTSARASAKPLDERTPTFKTDTAAPVEESVVDMDLSLPPSPSLQAQLAPAQLAAGSDELPEDDFALYGPTPDAGPKTAIPATSSIPETAGEQSTLPPMADVDFAIPGPSSIDANESEIPGLTLNHGADKEPSSALRPVAPSGQSGSPDSQDKREEASEDDIAIPGLTISSSLAREDKLQAPVPAVPPPEQVAVVAESSIGVDQSLPEEDGSDMEDMDMDVSPPPSPIPHPLEVDSDDTAAVLRESEATVPQLASDDVAPPATLTPASMLAELLPAALLPPSTVDKSSPAVPILPFTAGGPSSAPLAPVEVPAEHLTSATANEPMATAAPSSGTIIGEASRDTGWASDGTSVENVVSFGPMLVGSLPSVRGSSPVVKTTSVVVEPAHVVDDSPTAVAFSSACSPAQSAARLEPEEPSTGPSEAAHDIPLESERSATPPTSEQIEKVQSVPPVSEETQPIATTNPPAEQTIVEPETSHEEPFDLAQDEREVNPLAEALRLVVMTRLRCDRQTKEERVAPVLLANRSLAGPPSQCPPSADTVCDEIFKGKRKRDREDSYARTRPCLQTLFARRQAALTEKVQKLREEYMALHERWLVHCGKLDEVAKAAALEEAAATAGRTTRRSAALGDAVRTDLEMEQIIASLGNEELTDATHLAVRNAATIPDMISVTKGSVDYAYDDTNNSVEGPADLYTPNTCLEDWTEEEKAILLEKYSLYPKQFGIIADYLPNKTAAECVTYYYLHKKTLIDFRKVLARNTTGKRKRGGGRAGKKKGNTLLEDIRQHDAEVSRSSTPSGPTTRRKRGAQATETTELPVRRSSTRKSAVQVEQSPVSTPTPDPDPEPRRRRRAPKPTARAVAAAEQETEDDHMEAEQRSTKRARRSRKVKSTETVPSPVMVEAPLPFNEMRFVDQTEQTARRMPLNSSPWSDEEKALFIRLLAQHGDDFKRISASMPNKTVVQLSIYYKANMTELNLAASALKDCRCTSSPGALSDGCKEMSLPGSGIITPSTRASTPNVAPTSASATNFEAQFRLDDPSVVYKSKLQGSASGDTGPEREQQLSSNRAGTTVASSSSGGNLQFRSTSIETMRAQYGGPSELPPRSFAMQSRPSPFASVPPPSMHGSPFVDGERAAAGGAATPATLTMTFPSSFAYSNLSPSHFTGERRLPARGYSTRGDIPASAPPSATMMFEASVFAQPSSFTFGALGPVSADAPAMPVALQTTDDLVAYLAHRTRLAEQRESDFM